MDANRTSAGWIRTKAHPATHQLQNTQAEDTLTTWAETIHFLAQRLAVCVHMIST